MLLALNKKFIFVFVVKNKVVRTEKWYQYKKEL